MTSGKRRPDLSELMDLMVRDIQSGVLAPGMWLKQIDLEQRYQSTRPEIRRALDHLTQKRLVRHIPNRGYYIFERDSSETNEARDIRLILETGVAGRIIANACLDDIRRLNELASRFDDLLLNGTILELYNANLNFHRELLALCGNHELVNLVGELRSRTSSAPVSQWRTRARIELSGREHHEMVDAIAARDEARLRTAIDLHIRQPESDQPRFD